MNKEKLLMEAKSIFIILLLVFSFRSSLFEPFRIPSGSMIPTLNIGDFILVNKFSYGLKLPLIEYFGGNPFYLTTMTPPSRGDVIVFKYPKDKSIDYIKRVIGAPGDKIKIANKSIFLNGVRHDCKRIDGEEFMQSMVSKFSTKRFNFCKTKPGLGIHILTDLVTGLDNTEEIIVPKGYYFVMGDNRDFSSDSRVWGFVPKQNIKGKAVFVWLSIVLPFFGEHTFKVRPERIGHKII
jgi:signal peptidase I